MNPHSNLQPVFTGMSITDGAIINVNTGFPIGPSYRRLILDLHLNLTRSAGSLASAIGDLHYLRSLTFNDDRGNVYVNALQGLPLYYRNQQLSGTAARRTNIAATSAVYSTQFIIDFADLRTDYPDAFIVDTQDCKQMTLSMTFGAIGDLLSVSGDSLSAALDCYVDCTKNPVAPGSVKSIQQLSGLPPVDPSAVTLVDVPRVQGEFLKRLYFLTAITKGAYPFSGIPTTGVLTNFNFQTNQQLEYNQVLADFNNALNKSDYDQEAVIAGWQTLDFIKGRSLREAIHTRDFTTLQLNWLFNTGSNPYLSVMQDRFMARK